ncbi:MAG: glycosyltransferase family 2 protein, partial [Phycisphaerales bacterium]
MTPLSVAIVCKNAAATIGRTLDSVAGLADEVVALDSGSTDGTIALLERHGARVIHTEWKGYVATKQAALEACSRPWVLSLDSDESVEPDLRRSIEAVLTRDDASLAGGIVNRKVWYRDRPLNFAFQPEPRLRLVRRDRARWTGLDPHDQMEVVGGGRVDKLPGTLRHDSIATFAEFLVKHLGHARTMAKSLHDAGRRGRVLSLLASPTGAFLKQLVLKQAWRDGWPGWLAAGSMAA